MFVGVASFTVFIPGSGSRKAKRSVINAIKGRIQSRFAAAVSEVDDHDLWQRARMGVAVVGAEAPVLEEVLASIRRVAASVQDGEVVDYDVRVVPWPPDGSPWESRDG